MIKTKFQIQQSTYFKHSNQRGCGLRKVQKKQRSTETGRVNTEPIDIDNTCIKTFEDMILTPRQEKRTDNQALSRGETVDQSTGNESATIRLSSVTID